MNEILNKIAELKKQAKEAYKQRTGKKIARGFSDTPEARRIERNKQQAIYRYEKAKQAKELSEEPPFTNHNEYCNGLFAAYTVCEKLIKDYQNSGMGIRTSRLAIWDYYEKSYQEAKKWRGYYETWCKIAQNAFDHKVRADARHQAEGCLQIAKSWEKIAEQHFETIKKTYQ